MRILAHEYSRFVCSSIERTVTDHLVSNTFSFRYNLVKRVVTSCSNMVAEMSPAS
jgi:hypothetical protein